VTHRGLCPPRTFCDSVTSGDGQTPSPAERGPRTPAEPKQAWATMLMGPGGQGQSGANTTRRDAKSHPGFLWDLSPSLGGFIPRRNPPAVNMSDGTGAAAWQHPPGRRHDGRNEDINLAAARAPLGYFFPQLKAARGGLGGNRIPRGAAELGGSYQQTTPRGGHGLHPHGAGWPHPAPLSALPCGKGEENGWETSGWVSKPRCQKQRLGRNDVPRPRRWGQLLPGQLGKGWVYFLREACDSCSANPNSHLWEQQILWVWREKTVTCPQGSGDSAAPSGWVTAAAPDVSRRVRAPFARLLQGACNATHS